MNSISTLDAVSVQICILDEAGKIMNVNRAWRNFCDQHFPQHPDYFRDTHYLELFGAAAGGGPAWTEPMAAGLRALLRGERDGFTLEYPCRLRAGEFWLRIQAVRRNTDARYIVVTHENITSYKAIERALHAALAQVKVLELALARNEDALSTSCNELRTLALHLEKIEENERKRIAREIHDDLGQHLLALKIDVSMLHARTGAHPRLNEKVALTLEQIDNTMRSVKSIIENLRPPDLNLGLAAAIRRQVSEFERRTGIACAVAMGDDDIELGEALTATIFRIVQESLVNASRHAHASRVDITLHRDAGSVSIEVSDNGIGITLDGHKKRNSFGLVGMRERINAFGGQLTIERARGRGTTLRAQVPIHELNGPEPQRAVS